MDPQPVRLEPQFVPRIWGARSLAPLYPEKTNLSGPLGEVWLTGNDCLFAGGAFAGRKLAEAWRAMPPEWAGTRLRTADPFPLLVKFLFPEDILSVQVHPDDDYARQHEAATGWTGKTEMWHALAAREGAEVLVGLKSDVTRDTFRRAIEDGSAEKCLERLRVQSGDTFFVPAGTVHTIGPGSVLCEIQENSDLTYRVFDYGRQGPDGKPRPLHIEKALAVARFGAQPGGKWLPLRFDRGTLVETYCAACPHFATEKWEFTSRIGGLPSPERFELLIFLDGAGQLEAAGTKHDYARAQVWLLPAALGAYQLTPAAPSALLRAYVPDLDRLAAQLSGRRVPDDVLSRFIFRG
jgi:mannose-6-phosphate isomerase